MLQLIALAIGEMLMGNPYTLVAVFPLGLTVFYVIIRVGGRFVYLRSKITYEEDGATTEVTVVRGGKDG